MLCSSIFWPHWCCIKVIYQYSEFELNWKAFSIYDSEGMKTCSNMDELHFLMKEPYQPQFFDGKHNSVLSRIFLLNFSSNNLIVSHSEPLKCIRYSELYPISHVFLVSSKSGSLLQNAPKITAPWQLQNDTSFLVPFFSSLVAEVSHFHDNLK